MTRARRCAAACLAFAATGCVQHVNVVNVGKVEAGATVSIDPRRYTSLEAHGDMGFSIVALSGKGFDAPGGQQALAVGGDTQLRVTPSCAVRGLRRRLPGVPELQQRALASEHAHVLVRARVARRAVQGVRVTRAGIRQTKRVLE